MKNLINKMAFALLAVISIVILNFAICNNYTFAANTASVTLNLATDSSEQKTNNILKVNISFSDFSNVDTTSPIGMSAMLSYDTSIFSNVTISGKNGYSASIANGKIVIDGNSATEGSTIAEIDLSIKSGITANTKTDIKLTSIEIANSDDLEMSIAELKTTATIQKNTESTSDNNTKNETTKNTTTKENTTNTTNETKNDTTNDTGKNGVLYRNEITNKTTDTTTNVTNDTKNQNTSNSDENDEKVSKIEPVKDTTTSTKVIPQTGQTPVIILAIVSLIIVGVVTFIRYKKFYD